MPSQQLSVLSLFADFTGDLPRLWKRDRGCLRPAHVLYTVMTMSASTPTPSTHGYRGVLEYLKRTVGMQLGWSRVPFPSSFSEARRKLTPDVCAQAFHAVRRRSQVLSLPSRVSYRGLRVVAVDMTTLALPVSPSILEAFGAPMDNKRRRAPAPKATLTALWDISTNTPIDWKLEACYSSERFAAYALVAHLGPQDLLIADRGHASLRMLLEMQQQESFYVIRIPTGTRGGFREAHAFAKNPQATDEILFLHEDKNRRKAPTLRVRFIKKRLPSGEIAVFATNLFSASDHPPATIADLYMHRWDIETAFREMKIWHGLENFHARFADGIHQEVTALMLFMLLSAELEHQAHTHHQTNLSISTATPTTPPTSQHASTAKTTSESPTSAIQTPPIRFNRRVIAECIGYLLIAAAQGNEEFEREYQESMRKIWVFRQRKRPGRTFPRTAKSPNSKWKRTTYNTKK
jgi:Transposase DDE domain